MTRRMFYSLTCAPVALSLGLLAAAPAVAAGPKTIGLVLTDVRYAFFESDDTAKEECPQGLQPGEPAQARAQKGYNEFLMQYGGSYNNRGPNGEMGNNNPLAVEDPIPFREYKTTKGMGLNLDGTKDGAATAKTCKHEKFTSAEGEKVDNQMARVVGCVLGYRTSGITTEYYSTEVVTSNINRHLIEIAGVDDEVNDSSVDVTIYKGKDVVVRTAAGDKFVVNQSQRIDERFPQYVLKTKGKIVDGVLITDPIPSARMPMRHETQLADRVFTDLTVRVKLTAEGAEGYLAGFEDIENWFTPHSKKVISGLGRYSSAGLYRAALKYADGVPDPKTGQCTALSVAYKVKATKVLVVHSKKQPSVAMLPEGSEKVAMARE